MADAVAEPAVKALTCTACGAPVDLRAPGYTVSIVCAQCGSTLDALTPDLKLIERANAVAHKPRIPIGSRGELDGVPWDAVGYMERSAGASRWSEYLLFNPYYGYRFLIDDGRRWSFCRLLDGEPRYVGIRERQVEKLRLSLVEYPYDAVVRFVLGEFYWRVAVDETARVTDYATTGVMLSLEEAEDEATWTRSDLLDRGVVEKAFGIPEKIKRGQPLSPHEPSPWAPLVVPMWGIAVVACLVAALLSFAAPKQTDLGGERLTTTLDAPEQTATIGPFDLPRPHNRVVVRDWGEGLDNEWIDTDVSLVNASTQQSYDGYALAEHYSGYDSDGPWSEGSPDTEVVFSHVPRGRYNLVVDYSAHTWSNTNLGAASTTIGSSGSWTTTSNSLERPNPRMGLDVKVGGLNGWNLLLAILAILVPPGAVSGAQYMFQRRRSGAA